MAGHIELLLRVLVAAVELPSTDGMAVLVLAGVVGLAGGMVVLVARAVLATVSSSSTGVGAGERMAAAIGIPLLSTQSDPDAAGRPQPRAPGRPRAVAGL